MIKVALPNKGQLFEPTMDILSSCGYRVSKALKSLSTVDLDNQIEFFFLRPSDIPIYVARGVLDAGITGRDFVAEKQVDPVCLLDLDYGHSKFCAAAPQERQDWKTVEDLAKLRIATPFPTLARRFFPGAQIIELEGAVEISVRLGIADAVVDVVETGTTMRQAGLRTIGAPLFESRAALYAHPGRETAEGVVTLKKRLQGKILAHEYMMVEYDAPATILENACTITPGIESPTVTSLQKQGWFSVKSMIRKRDAQRILDELSRIGCKGILLTSIDSVRI